MLKVTVRMISNSGTTLMQVSRLRVYNHCKQCNNHHKELVFLQNHQSNTYPRAVSQSCKAEAWHASTSMRDCSHKMVSEAAPNGSRSLGKAVSSASSSVSEDLQGAAPALHSGSRLARLSHFRHFGGSPTKHTHVGRVLLGDFKRAMKGTPLFWRDHYLNTHLCSPVEQDPSLILRQG